MYFSLYEMMYNENVYFCYTRQCIITIFISLIHESTYRVIRDDVQ